MNTDECFHVFWRYKLLNNKILIKHIYTSIPCLIHTVTWLGWLNISAQVIQNLELMLYIYTRQNRAHICKLSRTFTLFQMLCVPHCCQLQPLYCCSIVFPLRGGQELRWLMRPLSSEAVINTVNRSRFSGLRAVTRSSCFSDRNIWGFLYARAAVGWYIYFFLLSSKGNEWSATQPGSLNYKNTTWWMTLLCWLRIFQGANTFVLH